LNVGLCGVAFFLVVLAITLWRTGRMAFTQRALCAAWPLSTMVFFLFENITEARIANYYSLINWVIFMVAALYASDPEALREPTPATRTAVARISSRTQPAPRRRHSTIPAYVAPRVADVRLGEPTIVERRWFARFRRSV
jgi:hypothetical protein